MKIENYMKNKSQAIIPELLPLYPFPWGYASRVARKLGKETVDVYNVVYGVNKHSNAEVISAIVEDVKEQKQIALNKKQAINEAAEIATA